MESKTHYQTLGVPPGATDKQIRARYLVLAEDNHPDKATRAARDKHDHEQHDFARSLPTRMSCLYCAVCLNTSYFADITAAYTVLKDRKRRAAYDAHLRLTGKPCNVCKGKGQRTRTGRGFKPITDTCPCCNGTGRSAAATTQAVPL